MPPARHAVTSAATHRPQPPEVAIRGEWLFKHDDVVFGPAPAQVIIDRLYRRELLPDDEVALQEGHWVPMERHPEFMRYVADATARLGAWEAAEASRKARLRWSIAAGAGGGVAVAALVSAVIILRGPAPGGRQTIDWSTRPPPLLSLGTITLSPAKTQPAAAEAPQAPAALPAAEPTGPAKAVAKAAKAAAKAAKKAAKAKEAALLASAGGAPPAADSAAATEDPDEAAIASKKYKGPGGQIMPGEGDGIQEGISAEQIMGVIRAKLGSLVPCIKSQIEADPEFKSRFNVSMTVMNDGSAANIEIVEMEYREGDFPECINTKVSRWKFPPYSGERQNVTFPVNISFNH